MNTQNERGEALTESACPKNVFGARNISITHFGPTLVLHLVKDSTDQQAHRKAGLMLGEDGQQYMHGWLFGIGDHRLYPAAAVPGSRWQVLEVDTDELTCLEGGVAFKRGYVLHTGDMLSATRYLEEHVPGIRNNPVIGACRHTGKQQSVRVGAYGHAVAGDSGRARAGDYGTAIAGIRGNAAAGESGFAVAGDRGAAKAGDFGSAHVGEFGTARVGHGGTAIAADSGTARAGDVGRATAGDYGTAQVGAKGTAWAGRNGMAAAGAMGEIRLSYWDTQAERARTVIGYIGENGLLPNTFYKLDESHQFTPADTSPGELQ